MIQTPRVVGNRAVQRAVNGRGIGGLHLAEHVTQTRPSWDAGENGGMRRISRQINRMLLCDQLILADGHGEPIRLELVSLMKYGTHFRAFYDGKLYIWHHNTRPSKKGQPQPEKATPELARASLVNWLDDLNCGLRANWMDFNPAGASISGHHAGEPIIMLGGIVNDTADTDAATA